MVKTLVTEYTFDHVFKIFEKRQKLWTKNKVKQNKTFLLFWSLLFYSHNLLNKKRLKLLILTYQLILLSKRRRWWFMTWELFLSNHPKNILIYLYSTISSLSTYYSLVMTSETSLRYRKTYRRLMDIHHSDGFLDLIFHVSSNRRRQ